MKRLTIHAQEVNEAVILAIIFKIIVRLGMETDEKFTKGVLSSHGVKLEVSDD